MSAKWYENYYVYSKVEGPPVDVVVTNAAHGKMARTIATYNARIDTELSFRPGRLITNLVHVGGTAYVGRLDGREGTVFADHILIIGVTQPGVQAEPETDHRMSKRTSSMPTGKEDVDDEGFEDGSSGEENASAAAAGTRTKRKPGKPSAISWVMQDPPMQGYLLKEGGGVFKSWEKRFVVLTEEGWLYTYSSMKEKTPSGAVDLVGCSVSNVEEVKHKKHCFHVYHPERKVVYFVAESAKEMQQWMTAIGSLVRDMNLAERERFLAAQGGSEDKARSRNSTSGSTSNKGDKAETKTTPDRPASVPTVIAPTAASAAAESSKNSPPTAASTSPPVATTISALRPAPKKTDGSPTTGDAAVTTAAAESPALASSTEGALLAVPVASGGVGDRTSRGAESDDDDDDEKGGLDKRARKEASNQRTQLVATTENVSALRKAFAEEKIEKRNLAKRNKDLTHKNKDVAKEVKSLTSRVAELEQQLATAKEQSVDSRQAAIASMEEMDSGVKAAEVDRLQRKTKRLIALVGECEAARDESIRKMEAQEVEIANLRAALAAQEALVAELRSKSS